MSDSHFSQLIVDVLNNVLAVNNSQGWTDLQSVSYTPHPQSTILSPFRGVGRIYRKGEQTELGAVAPGKKLPEATSI